MPVYPFWHGDLEPCSFSGDTGFGYRHTGNREDLAGEEEAKTGIFPVSLLEDDIFFISRDPNPVVFPPDDKAGRRLFCRYPDSFGVLAMPEGIIEEGEEDFLKDRISIYPDAGTGVVHCHISR